MFFAFTVPSVRGPFSCRTKSALVVVKGKKPFVRVFRHCVLEGVVLGSLVLFLKIFKYIYCRLCVYVPECVNM